MARKNHKPLKPLKGQLTFEFSLRRRILRKLKTMNDRVKHLLRVLDDHAGDGTDCFLKLGTIASEMCMAERTVQKTIREAEDEGWIVRLKKGWFWRCGECRGWNRQKDRPRVCGHCETDRAVNAWAKYRTCTTYRLRRAAMQHRAGVRDEEPATRTSCAYNAHDVRVDSAPRARSKKPSLKPQLKPSPPNPPTLFDVPTRPAGWEGVEELLIDFGCRSNMSIEVALAAARRRGCDPAQVTAVVEHASNSEIDGVRAWGPGAVLHRISTLRPGDDVSDGWPDPCEAYRKRNAPRRRYVRDPQTGAVLVRYTEG